MDATWKIELADGRVHTVHGGQVSVVDDGHLIAARKDESGSWAQCGFYAPGQWTSARKLSTEDSDNVDDTQFADALLYHVRCPKCGNVMPNREVEPIGDFVLDCCGHAYKHPTILLECIA